MVVKRVEELVGLIFGVNEIRLHLDHNICEGFGVLKQELLKGAAGENGEVELQA